MATRQKQVFIVGELVDEKVRDATEEGIELAGYLPRRFISPAVAYLNLNPSETAAVIKYTEISGGTNLSRTGVVMSRIDIWRKTIKNAMDSVGPDKNKHLSPEQRQQLELTHFHNRVVSLGLPYIMLNQLPEGVAAMPSANLTPDRLLYTPGSPDAEARLTNDVAEKLAVGIQPDINQTASLMALPDQA